MVARHTCTAARRDREQGGSPRIMGISNLTHASLTVDRRTRSCTSASYLLRRASNTLSAVWEHAGCPSFRVSTIEKPTTTGLGSTDVHTISHEATRAADLVPHDNRGLPRSRLRLQVHHQYTTSTPHHQLLKQWFRACIGCIDSARS